jgi:ribosomal protein S18 acetylase RimI-like enzyme
VLLELERGFPGDRLSPRSLRRLLGRPTAEVWVAEADGRVCADAVLLYRARARVARLYSLIVAPAARGRGIGAALLERAVQAAAARACARLTLEVRGDNAGAIALYRHHGFRPTRLLPGYYDDGECALRMARALTGAGTAPAFPRAA